MIHRKGANFFEKTAKPLDFSPLLWHIGDAIVGSGFYETIGEKRAERRLSFL
jgi:hypothetical protein